MVSIDESAVQSLVSLLQTWVIPATEEEQEAPEIIRENSELQAVFYLVLVAVCHQTQKLISDELGLRGWDLLFHRLVEAVETGKLSLAAEDLATFNESMWPLLFADNAERKSLGDLSRRASFIADIGSTLGRLGNASPTEGFHACSESVGSSRAASGMRRYLTNFIAYDDPVEKKSLFYLMLMAEKLWTFADPENLESPVDYHEIRLHLRLGTIRIVDQELLKKLDPSNRTRANISEAEDVQIRGAVREVVTRVARGSGSTPSTLHYMFWNLARQICLRERPRCLDIVAVLERNETLPTRYADMIEIIGTKRCPFLPVCGSSTAIIRPVEYLFNGHWY